MSYHYHFSGYWGIRRMCRVFFCVNIAFCLSFVDAHAFISVPRARGTLITQFAVDPQSLVPASSGVSIDYCPHCNNGGGSGVVKARTPGGWTPYEPLSSTREGFGVCGDAEGNNNHMKTGIFANPPSFPFSATYAPGGILNAELAISTNHNGYVEMYLCDVSSQPGQDISFQVLRTSGLCYRLNRVAHSSCESGQDLECGPIDPAFPGRWVLPCRRADGNLQVVGGSNGKMAFQLPEVEISVGVVQMYWLTQNSCQDPDGFMGNYNYPQAWTDRMCPGDGGSVGGKPNPGLPICGQNGAFPEEFWNCADVQVVSGGGDGGSTSTPPPPTVAPDLVTTTTAQNDGTGTSSASQDSQTTTNAPQPGDNPESGCLQRWTPCTVGSDTCCDSQFECGTFYNSSPMCKPVGEGDTGEQTTPPPTTTQQTMDQNDGPVTCCLWSNTRENACSNCGAPVTSDNWCGQAEDRCTGNCNGTWCGS